MTESSLSFTFEATEDGSPTLRLGPKDTPQEGLGEAMHSLKGAFSETVYIYGTAIETCISRGFPARVLSLGLGLGYVELLAAGLALREAKQLDAAKAEQLLASVGGESFELVPELRNWFSAWLLKEGEVPQDFIAAYDEILARTASHTGVDAIEIKTLLAELVRSQRWEIREALDAQTEFHGKFGAICFDAFSSKTSPDLWTEPFLMEFFAKACAEKCVLSTYACTGALKRSLRASGFELNIREGFSSKRDSTFAVRDL